MRHARSTFRSSGPREPGYWSRSPVALTVTGTSATNILDVSTLSTGNPDTRVTAMGTRLSLAPVITVAAASTGVLYLGVVDNDAAASGTYGPALLTAAAVRADWLWLMAVPYAAPAAGTVALNSLSNLSEVVIKSKRKVDSNQVLELVAQVVTVSGGAPTVSLSGTASVYWRRTLR
jgi:hypothetical protein